MLGLHCCSFLTCQTQSSVEKVHAVQTSALSLLLSEVHVCARCACSQVCSKFMQVGTICTAGTVTTLQDKDSQHSAGQRPSS